jgi:hypothetical protein
MTHDSALNINWSRFRADWKILDAEMKRRRFGATSFHSWEWGYSGNGGAILIIRDLILPPRRCSPDRTHLRLEVPPNLYRPVGAGRFAFYRNLWVNPQLQVWDPRSRLWTRAPRLFDSVENGFAYICVHPGDATEQDNILSVIATLDLHLTNPGLKAGNHEGI